VKTTKNMVTIKKHDSSNASHGILQDFCKINPLGLSSFKNFKIKRKRSCQHW